MLIGSDYRVDLEISADLSRPAISDQLSETVDYVHLNNIVKEEMGRRARLLEHVAERIVNRVLEDHPTVINVSVKVAKCNPPIGGNVEEVAVKREVKRTGSVFD